MPDLETLSRIAQAGAFVFIAVLLAGTWVAIGVGMVKGWWVPGRVYDREVARADKATEAGDANERTLAGLKESFDAIVSRALERINDR